MGEEGRGYIVLYSEGVQSTSPGKNVARVLVERDCSQFPLVLLYSIQTPPHWKALANERRGAELYGTVLGRGPKCKSSEAPARGRL